MEQPLFEPGITIEAVTDPAELVRHQAHRERADRNCAWLETHWAELLPRALGKHIAVAGQEVFVADTHEQAWALARAAHPEDTGAISQYVRPERGPRIYAHPR